MGANPLIQQWLFTSLLRRTDGGLLNLKDLLATLAPSVGPPSRVLSGDGNVTWTIY